jgi:hypothetical protein
MPNSKSFYSSFFIPLLFWIFSLPSFAGHRDDRHVVWVNLDEGQNGLFINDVIREFIESGSIDKECGINWSGSGSTLYMKKRPPGITNELIKKAFLEKNEKSLRDLNKFLKSFRDIKGEINEGLDGVVVYSVSGNPRMMNFVTGRKKIKTFHLASKKSSPSTQDVEDAFCVLLPPVTRAP